ncbi:hypothetical protein FB462_1128 [Curtobacterium citreum]|nr:hypothetical protein FB462_1128 [Curtobacterium citreum]
MPARWVGAAPPLCAQAACGVRRAARGAAARGVRCGCVWREARGGERAKYAVSRGSGATIPPARVPGSAARRGTGPARRTGAVPPGRDGAMLATASERSVRCALRAASGKRPLACSEAASGRKGRVAWRGGRGYRPLAVAGRRRDRGRRGPCGREAASGRKGRVAWRGGRGYRPLAVAERGWDRGDAVRADGRRRAGGNGPSPGGVVADTARSRWRGGVATAGGGIRVDGRRRAGGNGPSPGGVVADTARSRNGNGNGNGNRGGVGTGPEPERDPRVGTGQ